MQLGGGVMAIYEHEGVSLYYEVAGDATSGKAVAFMNGVMASVNSWYGFVPLFERFGYKVILHDFKGQTKSAKPAGPYSFAEHAREAKALFEHLGIERLDIIGTSYGGEVAMQFALDYPDAVRSITLIDSVSELDEVVRAFVLGWKTLCEMGGEKFFAGMAPSIYGPEFMQSNREMLAERAKATAAAPPEYFEGQKTLYDTFLELDITGELHRISCPALVLCGEDDILKKPKFSKLIAQRIPGAEYMLIPGSGHVAIFEKPNELASAMLGFVLKHADD